MLRGHFAMAFQGAAALTWDGPWRLATLRTGGPDGDDDDESALVRKLVVLDTILVLLVAALGG